MAGQGCLVGVPNRRRPPPPPHGSHFRFFAPAAFWAVSFCRFFNSRLAAVCVHLLLFLFVFKLRCFLVTVVARFAQRGSSFHEECAPHLVVLQLTFVGFFFSLKAC
jgi:hypothetical protein